MSKPAPPPPSILTDVEAFLARFKNPQAAVNFASSIVSLAVGVGILQAPIAGWLQGVIAAAGALVLAFASKPVTAKVARRAAVRAQRKSATHAATNLTVD